MNEVAQKRRTLMDAYDRLCEKVSFAEEIAIQSFRLIEKFERTEGISLPPNNSECSAKEAKAPNIIDLFDLKIARIDIALEKLSENIERAKKYID